MSLRLALIQMAGLCPLRLLPLLSVLCLLAKKIKLPQMNFVLEKQLIKFSCTYQPLSICKIFIKKILELIQSYGDVRHFWDQNSPFVLNKFFGTNHCYYFHLAIGPFHCAKFKQIHTTDLDDAPFLGPKLTICP